MVKIDSTVGGLKGAYARGSKRRFPAEKLLVGARGFKLQPNVSAKTDVFVISKAAATLDLLRFCAESGSHCSHPVDLNETFDGAPMPYHTSYDCH